MGLRMLALCPRHFHVESRLLLVPADPTGGGQVEMVNHPARILENEADEVERIGAVLANQAQQEVLRAHLQQGWKAFSLKSYMEAMRPVVAEFVERHASN